MFQCTLSDICYFDLRIVSTMTMFFTETFSSVHLERYHFITLNMTKDFNLYHALHIFSCRELITGCGKQHVGKFQMIAGISFYPGNIKCLVFLDPELAACDLYYCE